MPTDSAASLAEPEPGSVALQLIVLGGGQHARVVVDAARSGSGPWQVRGFVAPAIGTWHELPWLGDDEALLARLAGLPVGDRPALVLGFGGGESPASLATRTGVADGFPRDARWATVIHATAWVAPGATIEPGAVVLAHAVVNHGAHIERHAIVNSGAIVEHDVTVGAGSHIAPGAVIGGGARIGQHTFIGLGARIRDRVKIGDGVVVGMGAVVVKSVADGAQVVGIPARTAAPPHTDGTPR